MVATTGAQCPGNVHELSAVRQVVLGRARGIGEPMSHKPFDWMFVFFIVVALLSGCILGCVASGVVLALASLF